MKLTIALSLLCLAGGAAFAADTSPTNQLSDAIAKLNSATNYGWTTTTVMVDSQFTPGPINGQADKEGYARITQEFGDNTTEVVIKGDKVAIKTDDGWQPISQVEGFPAMMGGGLARNGAAAHEAEIILKDMKELKAGDGGVLSGDFTSEGATDLLTFGPRRAAGADGGFPPPKDAKGSAKFWIKDGQLVKYETHLTGSVSFGDNDTAMNITRTVEIKDVGTTKLDIPAEAKKQLEAK